VLNVGIPGFRTLRISELVLDYNGTLALDGRLLRGERARLEILSTGGEDKAKAAYVRRLGSGRVACIGNGRNDRQAEGASVDVLAAADLVAPWVSDALDVLLKPGRLVASLRS
jgi:soluble P-type ATPase